MPWRPWGTQGRPLATATSAPPLFPESATGGSSSPVARARRGESRSPSPKRVCGALAPDVSVAPKEEEVVPVAAEEEVVAPSEVVKATVSNDDTTTDNDNDEEYNDNSDSVNYYHSPDGGTHVVYQVDYSSGKTLYSCWVCKDREFEYKEEVQVHALRLFRDNVGVPDDIERHRQIAWDAGYKSSFKKRPTSSSIVVTTAIGSSRS